MSLSQDVVVSVLFPYLLPSLPVCKKECWSKEHTRNILEELLVFYCSTSIERSQDLLESFVRRVLVVSSSCDVDLDDNLKFLADIEERCSFIVFDQWESSVYSFYTCTSLIEHKANISASSDFALRLASRFGHKCIVALLLKHKANVHAIFNQALGWASQNGHKDTVDLLLQHNANVHASNNAALRWASENGHKDTVDLLLQHNANVHASDDAALRCASKNGHKDTAALLLKHKANVHAENDEALRCASENGHEDIVSLLLVGAAAPHTPLHCNLFQIEYKETKKDFMGKPPKLRFYKYFQF
jgi:hypothetical protein